MTPGNKSTEWLATVGTMGTAALPILAGLIDVIRQSGAIQNPMLLMILGMVASLLASLGYTASRTVVKMAHAKQPSLRTEVPGSLPT